MERIYRYCAWDLIDKCPSNNPDDFVFNKGIFDQYIL